MSSKKKKATTFSLNEDRARRFAERIYVLLMQGQFPAAHRVLHEAKVSTQDKKNSELKETPIAQIDLPERVINLLEKAGFHYVGDLIGIGEDYLKDTIVMCGEKTVELIKEALIKEIVKREKL